MINVLFIGPIVCLLVLDGAKALFFSAFLGIINSPAPSTILAILRHSSY